MDARSVRHNERMPEPVEVDLLRVARDGAPDQVVAVLIGSEQTDSRETQIADGLAADTSVGATVVIDDLYEGIAVVHVHSDPTAPDEVAALIDRTTAAAVIEWFAALGTPVKSVAIDARIIVTADADARVEALESVSVALD